MEPRPLIPIPKSVLTVLNQLYEMEQKLARHGDPANLGRNVGKMKDALAEEGLPATDATGAPAPIRLVYENPMGQPFQETRTDLEATIAGPGTDDLVVVEVIKPIIRAVAPDGFSPIVQAGVVVVESRKGQ